MLIDWFTVIAQLINFLVLVWLLKRFLYHPILDAIDAREKRIADELADADEKRAEAEQQRETFQQKNAEFDQQRIATMSKVAEEAKAERARLLDLVRLESDALRSQLELALKNEQLSLQDTLSQHAREEVFAIARKVLSDLAESSLEASMVTVLAKRLEKLNEAEKTELVSAFKASAQALIVRTAFDLAEEQRALIKTAINKLLDDAVEIQFSTEPEVVSGIEISGNGQKIAWSIADYLATLAQRVNQVLQSHDVATMGVSKEEDNLKELGSHEPHA